MTKTPQVVLALVGTAITVVVLQYVGTGDPSVAAKPAPSFRLQPSDRRASDGGRRVAGESEILAADLDGTTSPGGARARTMAGESSGENHEKATEPPAAPPASVFGITVPAWVDEMLGRPPAVPAGGGTMASTPNPPTVTPTTSSSTAATSAACNLQPAPNPQGITAQLGFVGVLQNGQQREGDNFTGAELDDLKILVEWKSLFQNHAQRLDLIAPDGSLYQSLSRLVTADNVGSAVETRVPVNGSWITRYGLYGTWCIEVFVDQESAPVTSSRLVIARPQ